MAQRTYFIAQAFNKQGRRLVPLTPMTFPTADQAIARAQRDAQRYSGAVAFKQIADDETGETLDEPQLLARHGTLPSEFADD